MGRLYRIVLLGEQAASKTARLGSNPRDPACPDGVTDRIRPSEGRGPGSNPGRDADWTLGPASVAEARQSSKLPDEVRLLGGALARKQLVLGVCRNKAREPAKLVDQVRFLARTLNYLDAGARRHGDRLQSGSSGFDSRRRLLNAAHAAARHLQAAHSMTS